jgi:putative solute:sodium symporter small subunit
MAHNPSKTTLSTHAAYWQHTRRLTVWLLLAWFLVTFGIIFFARELSSVTLFGWPFSFYMAAQGTVLIYVMIVAVYAWRMRCYDKILKGYDAHGH